MASNVSHIANLSSQLKQVLHDVVIETMKYNNDKINSGSCPCCGEIWQKIEGLQQDRKHEKKLCDNLKSKQATNKEAVNSSFKLNGKAEKVTDQLLQKEAPYEEIGDCAKKRNWSNIV